MSNLLDNRYRIIQVLGGGGFGDTFLAEDTQMPSQRRCVIKQLKPITNNPQVSQIVRERFKREAAILEILGHESRQIPNLFAYFNETDQFYLVQEWIDGNTLTQTLQAEGRLGENAVRQLLLSILPVLELVHAKGIVHRDIKPDNIILRRSDRLPVLIDFGAVRETMGTKLNSQGNTTSSIVIGTPGYMPSEQAAGRPVFSSDLYSLGLTAVYLLTGKAPQDLDTDLRTGEIVWQPHAFSVSDAFAQIISRSIQSHPRDRYPTASDMLAALRTLEFNAVPPTSPGSQPTLQVPPPISQPGMQRGGYTPPTVRMPPVSPVPSTPPPTVPVTPQAHMQGLPGIQPSLQGTQKTTPVDPIGSSPNNWLKPAIFLGVSLGLSVVVGYFVAQRVSQSNIANIPSSPTQSFTPSPSPTPPSPTPTETPPSPTPPSPPPSPTAPPSTGDYFGAIARSREGGKGYSWNYSTRAGAEQRAITECNSVSTTKNCEVLVWFKNACGSIAEATEGGAGSGWGVDTALAEKNALESCSTVGSGCKVTRTICAKQ